MLFCLDLLRVNYLKIVMQDKLNFFQIFMTNEFFFGVSIPSPTAIEPLERKFTKDLAGPNGLDFLKVKRQFPFGQTELSPYRGLFISYVIILGGEGGEGWSFALP